MKDNNSGAGTSGLAGDCAACHRAHTAQAESLLKEELPGLCLNCHNGAGATTDVVDGMQFKSAGNPTAGNVLGALRGGGFTYALIDSSNPSRLGFGARTTVTFDAVATGGTFTVTVDGNTSGAIAWNANATAMNTALSALIGSSTTYTSLCSASTCSGQQADNILVSNVTTGTSFRLNFKNEAALTSHTVSVNVSALTGVTSATATASKANSPSRLTGAVPVLDASAVDAVNSTHTNDGTAGTLWGSGTTGVGPTVSMNCASCHNPHGNGMYRILQTTPGENFSPANAGFGREVEVQDVGVTTSTKNYTVQPGVQAIDVTGLPTDGDYFRKRYDPTGTSTWSNFYLLPDPMNTGWNGTAAVNSAEGTVLSATGTMTAWCVSCHTRYSTATGTTHPFTVGANTSTGDPVFNYRHTTSSSVGCEQCHVSHGSNADMRPGTASADVTWPSNPMNFTPGAGNDDSRLLKVDNRGTCQLCHDPTDTVDPGDTVGTVPAP